MKPVGWAIIGIGKLADIAIAPAISRHPDIALAAVCGRDRQRARAFAARHGATRSYVDEAEMLADPAVDIVYVATPNALHRDHTMAALRAGKHVLVEKPMTLTAEAARDVVDAAAEADRRLGVGLQLRHKATNRAARDAIADGRIGTLAYIDVTIGAGQSVFPYGTWRSDTTLAGGGTLLNQATHAIDLIEFVAGEPIVEVAAMVDPAPLEDVFAGTCRMRSGALATIASHQVADGPRRDWSAVGRDGWLEGRGASAAAPGDELVLHAGDAATVLARGQTSAYDEEIAAFTDAVRGRRDVSGDGDDGLRNVAVAEALYRAARTGGRVAV